MAAPPARCRRRVSAEGRSVQSAVEGGAADMLRLRPDE